MSLFAGLNTRPANTTSERVPPPHITGKASSRV